MDTINGAYGKTQPGIYKGGAVFYTHDAEFYLDKNKQIVGIACDKILRDGSKIGEETECIVLDGLGNSVLYGINHGKNDVSQILDDVNIVYQNRIKKKRLQQFIASMKKASNVFTLKKSNEDRDKIEIERGETVDLEITKQGGNYSVRWENIDYDDSEAMNSKILQISSHTKQILEELPSERIQIYLNAVSEILLAELDK